MAGSYIGDTPQHFEQSWCLPHLALPLELNVLPALDSTGQCPQQLVAYETLRPYSEGGEYARDGMIQLSEIATGIALTGLRYF